MATTKVTMRLEGFDALQRAIVKAPNVVKAHAGSAVGATAFAVAQRMRSLVRVDTGRLRQAIEVSSRGLSGRVLINPSGFYWPFLEYGTVRMAARPFVRPAAEAETSDFLTRVRDIGKKLERDWSAGRFV